jgi:hypothetical protein
MVALGSDSSVRLFGLIVFERENQAGQNGRVTRQERKKTEIDRRNIN